MDLMVAVGVVQHALLLLNFATGQEQHKNKTNISSSLMCGSNAAGEAMPLHIMFSSDAKDELNYAVNAAWIVSLPRVTGRFGHDEEKSFTASLTTNENGGTDGH